MRDPVDTHCLLNQRRIMPASQLVGLGLFTHLCKQPTSLELDEQIIHGRDSAVTEGIQF